MRVLPPRHPTPPTQSNNIVLGPCILFTQHLIESQRLALPPPQTYHPTLVRLHSQVHFPFLIMIQTFEFQIDFLTSTRKLHLQETSNKFHVCG